MCNIINLKPIEFYENKKTQGINIDLLNLIGKKINVKFENPTIDNAGLLI